MANTEHHTEKLFLIDAYALIFRAYFAFSKNPLLNSKGQDVSAISGFTNTLFELIQKEKPTHLAVVFDLGGSVEREADYADYKAGRQETPEGIMFADAPLCNRHNLLRVQRCHLNQKQQQGELVFLSELIQSMYW